MSGQLNHYGLKVHRFGAKAPPWTSHGLKAAVLKVRSFDYNALRALKRPRENEAATSRKVDSQ